MRKTFALLIAGSFVFLGGSAMAQSSLPQSQSVTHEGGSTPPKAQAAGEAKKEMRMEKTPATAPKTDAAKAIPKGDTTPKDAAK